MRWKTFCSPGFICTFITIVTSTYILFFFITIIANAFLEDEDESQFSKIPIFGGPITAIIGTFFTLEKKFKHAYENAKNQIDVAFEFVNNKVTEASEVDLENQTSKDAEISQLNSEIKNLNDQMWLKEGETFKNAIDARLEDTVAYEKKLDVVHKSQKDLEILCNALLSPKNRERLPRGEPRIFLFIDDLDRCTPRQAVEMLEVIQLLAKTKPIVVVVMADLRYLTQCLEQHPDYKDILKRNGCISGMQYVEKVIQLSYRLPYVNDVYVVRSYVRNQIQIGNEDILEKINHNNTKEKSTINQRSQSNTNVNQSEKNAANSGEESNVTPNTKNYERSVNCNNEELMRLSEVFVAAGLNPRCMKRVTNCYKLLKFIWGEKDEKKDEKIASGCIVLLGLCASSTAHVRNDMKMAFSWLERRIIEPEENFYEFLRLHVFQGKDFGVWPVPCYKMAKEYFSLDWNEFESDFWLARCFSFVGDYVEDEILESIVKDFLKDGSASVSYYKKLKKMLRIQKKIIGTVRNRKDKSFFRKK